MIILIVFGSAVLVIAIVVITMVCLKCKKNKSMQATNQSKGKKAANDDSNARTKIEPSAQQPPASMLTS